LYQSHSESLLLSAHAEDDLAQGDLSSDYQDYSRAVFGFQQALDLWSGNVKAAAALSRARLAYATCALKKEDFDLAASVLDADDRSHDEVRSVVVRGQRERNARVQRLKTVRRLVAGLVALLFVGGSAAYYQISIDRDLALKAEALAAEKQADEAAARVRAEAATREAERAKTHALEQESIAKSQRAVAETEKERAQQARDRADAAKQLEQYAGYIARIGLAAARIDENAFDNARELLEGCERPLRHWEWGRLLYLCERSLRSVTAAGPIDAVAVSGDGRRFAAGSWDGLARVWDLETAKPLAEFAYAGRQPGKIVRDIAFAPGEGNLLAVCGNDREAWVKLWDATTGKVVRSFTGHADVVTSVAFSPNGHRLLTASLDKTVRLWDVETGRELRVLRGHSGWVWSAAFSPTSTDDAWQVITASQDGTALVWTNKQPEPSAPFTGHNGPVYAADFSPDGKRVVTAGYDQRALIWDPTQLKPFDYEKIVAGEPPEPPPFDTLVGHTAAIRSVRFSSDGKMLLTASQDNTVKLWALPVGNLLKTLRGHGAAVYSAAFSPDDQQVVSGSYDQRVMVWNLEGYAEARVLQASVLSGHADAVMAASFSPDGRLVVTASRDRQAKTWDLSTGRAVRTFDEGHAFLVSSGVFATDGRRLVTAAVDNTTRVWDTVTGGELLKLEHTGRAAAVALSPDGRTLLTGSDDKRARLWDASSGKLQQTFEASASEVSAVEFSPDGSQALLGDGRGELRLFEAATGKKLAEAHGHNGAISGLAFVGSGSRILSASNDQTVGQWDGRTLAELPGKNLKHPAAVTSVSVVGGRTLTCCEDGIARLWEIETAKVVLELRGTGDGFRMATLSADGSRALTASADGLEVRLWDMATGREVRVNDQEQGSKPFIDLAARGSLVWSVAFSPDGASVLTVGGNEARLWNAATGVEAMTLGPHGALASAAFSHDGRRMITASWDNSAKIWDVATGKDVARLVGKHRGAVNDAVFSPDDRLVATASDDHTIQLWDAHSSKPLQTLVGHTARVRSASFSTDGQRIVSAADDRTVRIWDVASGQQLGADLLHNAAVLRAAFSTDGSRVISGNSGTTGNAHIWDVASGKELTSLEGHTAGVGAVAFSPDGRRVLTGSQDALVKLWDPVTGKEILNLKGHSQEVTSVSFSPNGVSVLTSSRDGKAVVWPAVHSGWGDPTAQVPAN
jgi:WD40 repeat protein